MRLMPRLLQRVTAIGWPTRWPRSFAALALAVGLVLLAIIPAGMAQSARRAQPNLQNATRALIEGRYDEVATLTAALDGQDPAVVALSARALIARGRYQEAESALRPAAERAPASDAALELGLLLQMLGRPEAQRAAQSRRGRACLGRERRRRAARARARALRALDSSRTPTPRTARPWRRAARPRDQHRLGRAVPREVQHARSAAVVPGGARGGGRTGRRPCSGRRARCPTRTRRRRSRSRKQVLEINPSDVDAHVFLADQAVDAGKRDEARELLQKALAVNPSSLDARSLLAGAGLRRRQARGVRGRGRPRCSRSRRATARSTAWPASCRAQLPVRRSGDAGAPRASARAAATRGRSPTSGCICCGPATSRRRATALEAVVQDSIRSTS